MIDITHKSNTLRSATARAIVKVGSSETIKAVKNNEVPKGNVFEMAKTAGLFAVKQTAQVIPDCHPLPVESTKVNFNIVDAKIVINVEVKTIYKTGVEVEAMHGASVVALTIYDMLKPIDKDIEIHNIKLINKTGGKSSFKDNIGNSLKAAIIVCSDSISAGKKEDRAGKAIIEKLEYLNIHIAEYVVIPDEKEEIQGLVEKSCADEIDIVIVCGGTGLSPRDISPEAVKPLLDREIPGIAEAARVYGQQRTPYAMLSRSIVGMKNDSLVMAIPGSTKGASETIDALFPAVLHVFKVAKGARHD